MADAASIINQQAQYASSLTTAAKPALDAARNAIQDIPTIYLNAAAPIIPNYVPIVVPTRPSVGVVSIALPSEPVPPASLADIDKLNIDVSMIPALTATLGAFVSPSVPAGIADFNKAVPIINLDAKFPEVPAILSTILSLPVLPTRSEPVAPSVVIPVFDKSAPGDLTVAPPDYATAVKIDFKNTSNQLVNDLNGNVDALINKINPQFNAQMSAIEAKYTQYLAGGTAVVTSVANAIYEQEKEKQNAELRRTSSASRDQAAKWGFTVPTGFVVNALQMARQAAADNNAKASRDIAINQFNKEQENMQFVLVQSKEMRLTILQNALSYANTLVSVNNIALDHAKTVMQAMVEGYNQLVRRYEIALEGYKTEATVYETKLRGALAVVDLYKAEIQALEALTSVDRSRVDIFRAEVDSLQAYAGIYKTRVEAVVQKAQLEKLKIEVFGAEVEAYKATISGKTVQWEGYRAALQSNEVQASVYGKQVDAYRSEVEAFKAIASTKAEVITAEVQRNEALVRQYTSQIEAYRAQVQGRSEFAKIQLELNKQQLDNYRSELDTSLAIARNSEEYYKLTTQTKLQESDQKMKIQFKQADLWIEKAESIAKLSEGLAQIYTGAAQGAVNGINALVTLAV